MTQYVNQGPVVGQPMSPFFGAQNGLGATPVIQQPTTAPTAGGMQATGVQMSILEACSRGIIPRNANIASVAGVAASAGISNTNGNSLSFDDAMSNGNGAQASGGVAVASVAVHPDEASDAAIPALMAALYAERLAAPEPVVQASDVVALPPPAEVPCTQVAGPSAA